MSQVIRISNELFKRLENHAEGFDTPAKVIEKILDQYEGLEVLKNDKNTAERQPSKNLELIFEEGSEDSFKEAFISKGIATLILFFTDGSQEKHQWKKNNFTIQSSVKGNLLSGKLRGWKKKGVTKAMICSGDM